MVCRSVTYVPGLYKIFDEILVRAADNKQSDPSMDSVKVVIDIEKNLISVCNSGDGVPVEIHQEEGVYVPEMIFGHLLTSSNYDDNVKKTTGGRNGYGAKLTNIFSTEFIIEIADGKRRKKYKQVFENNMGKKSEPDVTKCNKSENWTKVTFKPDLKKFNMTKLENDVVALMSKRVFDIAGCLGETVKVELNGKRVPITDSDQNSIPSMVDGLKPSQRKILFCAFNEILDKQEYVYQFSCYVLRRTAYQHSVESLASTIISMAQDYVGSNNVNLLQPNGLFGTRNSGGKDAGNASHLSTKLSPATRVLFPKDDDVLLDYLNEDGKKIEPTWYMPIIPTVLVNGAEGIGSGLSTIITIIPNYNPRDIVANIRHLLKGESMEPMHPWYRGFKGTIEKSSKESGSYTTTGLCEEVDEKTLRITELPIGKWTDDYKQFLKSMKADNGVSFIQSIKESGYYGSVHFDLILSEENMMAARAEGFLKKFKLTTTIATSSMHLLDKKDVPKNYATAEEILEEFFYLRLEYYEKRKEIMLKNLESELLKLDNKVKFILTVLREEREMSKMKDADFVQELRRRGFPPFPKVAKHVEAAVAGATDGAEESEESSVAPAPSSPLIPDSDYDYILAIRSLTIEKEMKERAKELTDQRDQVRKAVEELKKVTPKTLWLSDLEAFEMELDKLDQQDADAGVGVKGRKQVPNKPAPKRTTKKASESETTETSNSAMDTDNNVAEVVKPKGRQGARKKAPAAKVAYTDQIDQVRKAVEELKKATPRYLWRLDAFEKELDKLDEKTKKASESVTRVASNSAMDTET